MLELDSIAYRYPGSADQALLCTSLRVGAGERVGVLGANGSGKSTLLHVACGSVATAAGRILLEGEGVPGDEGQRDLLRRSVGLVGQDPDSRIVTSRVFDEVAFGPCNLGLPLDDVRERVAWALDACGIADLAGREVWELSGGQRQLVCMAAVLSMRPRYLCLDEPCSMLDGAARACVLAAAGRAAEAGAGVVLVTHELEDLLSFDRVVVMEAGRTVWVGTPRQLLFDREAIRRSCCLETAWTRALQGLLAHGLLSEGADLGDPQACARAVLAQGPDQVRTASRVLSQVGREGLSAAMGIDGGEGCRGREEKGAPFQAQDLSFSYGDSKTELGDGESGQQGGAPEMALYGVSLACQRGGVTLVTGAAGSGKSTLLRLCAGLATPSAGWAGAGDQMASPALVGLSFQRPSDMLFADTVLDDVAFGPRNLGLDRAAARDRAKAQLEALDLDPEVFGDRSPFALSGGQARRVALAGVLACRTPFVALDEPTVGLDAPGLEGLVAMVGRLTAEGRGVLLVTHDAARLLTCADELVVLDRGRVAWQGPARAGIPTDVSGADDGRRSPRAFMEALGEPAGPSRQGNVGEPGFAEGACGGRPGVCGEPAAADRASAGQAARPRGLDPRVKIGLLFFACLALLFIQSLPALLAALALGAALLIWARVPPKSLGRGGGYLLAALVVLAAANALRFDGSADLALGGLVGISWAGLAAGAAVALRLAAMTELALALDATTPAATMGDALGRLLAPLGRLGLPAEDMAMGLSLALRFIPLVRDELARVKLAQRARGAKIGQGGPLRRVTSWIPALIPLLVGLFRRASEVGEAMRARCYRGSGRTTLSDLSMGPRDWAALALGGLACLACALVC